MPSSSRARPRSTAVTSMPTSLRKGMRSRSSSREIIKSLVLNSVRRTHGLFQAVGQRGEPRAYLVEEKLRRYRIRRPTATDRHGREVVAGSHRHGDRVDILLPFTERATHTERAQVEQRLRHALLQHRPTGRLLRHRAQALHDLITLLLANRTEIGAARSRVGQLDP